MIENLRDYVADVADFPEKGIIFRDISPLLAKKFPETIDQMTSLFSAEELERIDAFAGVDSRGFIFSSGMAQKTGKQLILSRKAGKLPPPYIERAYDLEYSSAKLQMKKGSGNIVIVDDVLATGGTLQAAADLCAEAGYTVKGFAVLIDLVFLNDFSWNGMTVRSVIRYETP